MKLISIENSNAGDGFKLVTVGFSINGELVQSDWFVHPDGRVEPHKNTGYDLENQVKRLVKMNVGKLGIGEKERNAEIAQLEKRLIELKGI